MKTNAIVRIVILSITVLVLLGVLLAGLGIHSYFTDRTSVSESTDLDSISGSFSGESTYTVDTAGVTEIDIEWVSGSITIQPGDVEAVTFTESEPSDSKYAMVWKQSGNKLSIEFCKESLISGFGVTIGSSWDKDLLITVPRDWSCSSLEIDTASSDVEVRDLTVQEVEIDAASAQCSFENCTFGTLDVDTASGDVDFSGTLKVLEFDAASASFTGIRQSASIWTPCPEI